MIEFLLLFILVVYISLLLVFTVTTGQWQWSYDLPKGGGTMGSWGNPVEAYIWRLLNPIAFREGTNYRLKNYK